MDQVADPRPLFIEQVPIRQVFPRESDFERLFAEELRDDDSTLPDLLGIDAGHIVRQQQTDGLRPDVLVYRVGADGTRCEAVIEITLESLDVDHLRRAVSYAIENHAESLTIITKAIDPDIIETLERYRERTTFNINVLILRVYLTGEEQYGYHLESAFPDQAEQESTSNNAQRTLLELTKRDLYRLQDSSLQHLRVQANGRIDWYPEGANIRLYAAKAYTSITIKVFDRGDTPSHFIHRNMMRESHEFEEAVTDVLDNGADYEISWHDQYGKATEPRLLVRIRYGEGRMISDLNEAQLEQAGCLGDDPIIGATLEPDARLLLWFGVPRVAEPFAVLDAMIAVAALVVSVLGGRVVDEDGDPLDVLVLRARVADLVERMNAAHVVPGHTGLSLV